MFPILSPVTPLMYLKFWIRKLQIIFNITIMQDGGRKQIHEKPEIGKWILP